MTVVHCISELINLQEQNIDAELEYEIADAHPQNETKKKPR